ASRTSCGRRGSPAIAHSGFGRCRVRSAVAGCWTQGRTTVTVIGELVEVEVGPIAHGGHCVARLDGRVVFVRHSLPGERVRARITEGGETSRFLRADAVEVLVAAAGRVPSRCEYA